jgi:superfamily I DNA/RNA helicase/RecB family exonuclease
MAVSKSKSSAAIQLDPEQQQAVEHVAGPMLVVAGAGTGKTTVLIRRIARLVREGHARPDEILALTYTDNAAKEMLERAQHELRGSGTAGLQISTFHAYCNNLLIRSQCSFGVLLDKDLWIFLRRNIRELKLNHFVRAAHVAKFLDDLMEFMRRCQDELVGPAQYAEYVRRIERRELPVPRVSKSKDADELSANEALGRCREIAFVFETVERMLRERNLGTFGHMILRASELLREDPALLARERARARFILVDEFQDANFAQIKVLEKLAGTQELGGEDPIQLRSGQVGAAQENVFAVGDPDQGIYRFRGASSGAFELFQKHFPESKLVVLAKNRRSTAPVLNCAHALIAKNPEFALHAGATQYRRSPLISARDEAQLSTAAPRALVEAVCVSGSFMEAADLVSILMEKQMRSRCDWKDIGILYRSHFHRDDVAAELARHNIPFSIEGLDVMDTAEVRDFLACLGAVISGNDSAALFRVAALHQFAVDPNELRSALKELPRDAKAPVESVLPQVKGGAELLAAVERAREQVAGKRIYAALLKVACHFQVPRNPAIEAILKFANQWEESPITQSGGPAEFLEYLTYFREAHGIVPLASSEDKNSVKLMTAHSAKGLEFDHVLILRAVSNSFPSSYREPLIELPAELRNSRLAADCDEKEVHKQEERRLFYVAMTRARDTLSIYGQFGRGKNDKTPPGYLRELIKDPKLKNSLKERKCREFQADIFGAAEPLSRLGEWIALPPTSDLAATLSASSIQHYETCPLQFKLEREWRIPAEVSAALQYGASMHRVLLAYYDSVRARRTLSEAALLELLLADLADAGFADRYQRELYEQKGTAELREFLASSGSGQAEVLHTEERFSIKVGPTNLVGRVDRIDRASGDAVVITDYKTGRPRSQEDADESLQLSLYALAAHEKWGYHAERLVFHNLEGNTTVSTERSQIQIDEAKLKVEEIAEKISAGKFEPKVGIHCGWCAYRVLCPKTEKRLPNFLAAAAIKSAD